MKKRPKLWKQPPDAAQEASVIENFAKRDMYDKKEFEDGQKYQLRNEMKMELFIH
jgi:hypothetical protein